jgi:HD-GYP domain-containing protein (c-di-GMP phosphodiesterase class II)
MKPSSLTEEEKRIAQSHPVIGTDFLQSAKFPPQIVAIVRHHHEHYNGKGYPDGIKGEEISLGARIISVANSFDAMTSERAFRGAHTPEEALEEIQLDMGTQYDPEVVKAFASIMGKRVYSIPKSG